MSPAQPLYARNGRAQKLLGRYSQSTLHGVRIHNVKSEGKGQRAEVVESGMRHNLCPLPSALTELLLRARNNDLDMIFQRWHTLQPERGEADRSIFDCF